MEGRSESSSKRLKREESGVKLNKLNNLPDIPFEKILSYLPLEDLVRSRAVAPRWYRTIDRFRVNSLFYSDRPSGHIFEKSRLVNDVFAQNFICSHKVWSFFNTFANSILLKLKRLRFYRLDFNAETQPLFDSTRESFVHLEELSLFHVRSDSKAWAMKLPMLRSFRLEDGSGFKGLIFNSPKLLEVRCLRSKPLVLDFVQGDCVERLTTDEWRKAMGEKLKNLKYLYCEDSIAIYSTILADLKVLKEIHVSYPNHAKHLFERRKRYERFDLRIFLFGCLLDGPDNPAMESSPHSFNEDTFCTLVRNHKRLADEIPFCTCLDYEAIIAAAPESPELAINVLKRFIDLKKIIVHKPVQNTGRFLDLLKSFGHISELQFDCDQPQELYDRLPEHCAVQWLAIDHASLDIDFLLRLSSIIHLSVACPIDAEYIRKAFEKLKFLSTFHFRSLNKKNLQQRVEIAIRHPKGFHVTVQAKEADVADRNAAIQFITENV